MNWRSHMCGMIKHLHQKKTILSNPWKVFFKKMNLNGNSKHWEMIPWLIFSWENPLPNYANHHLWIAALYLKLAKDSKNQRQIEVWWCVQLQIIYPTIFLWYNVRLQFNTVIGQEDVFCSNLFSIGWQLVGLKEAAARHVWTGVQIPCSTTKATIDHRIIAIELQQTLLHNSCYKLYKPSLQPKTSRRLTIVVEHESCSSFF